ncbi:MAG TPA: phosphoenolpyruvate--protein phosphotransferase [Gemmatimonadales bacterium]|nr:phosphoenolpyruvate--protein phosphotransferase [Gemmatimonadales bacterium]
MNASRRLRGIGVSPGTAYAPAVVIRWDFPNVPDRSVRPDEVEGEVRRLHEAVAHTVAGLHALKERAARRAGIAESRIFDAQIMMAQDRDFLGAVEQLIRNNHFSAETAYEFKALELQKQWQGSGNALLRDRVADLSAIHIRVLGRLVGLPGDEPWVGPASEHVIVVARELSPGLTVQLDRDHVVGLVSEEGTRTSHAAILAHSLGIPAVMGVPGALARITPGTMVLLDGQTGELILDPSGAELELAKAQKLRRRKLEIELETLVSEPAVTPDGRTVVLMGNVDLPEEIEPAVAHGAQGVGLLRTEFLVTGRTSVPTEEDQFLYFRRVADAFLGHPVIVRTYDLGGDKFPAAFDAPHEANPFLGWRSIRVCLDHPEIFRPQLRAILRAAVDRNVQVMLPLVTRVDEVLRTRAMLEEEAAALAAEGVRAAASVPVGVMIETPAAVVIADRLAEVSAFFSVGTNDLTQYTLAVDRGNARLADRFTPLHPAVVRQLKTVIEVGRRAGIPVSVCGEMASDHLAAVLLVGLGYDCLSVAPPALPMIKWVLRTVPLPVAERAAAAALDAVTAEGVTECLRTAIAGYIDERLV